MKFEEFHAGQLIDVGAVLSAKNRSSRSQASSIRSGFTSIQQRARASRWNGLIASGWHTCCLAMKLVVDNVLAGSESFGSPGLTDLKWSNPVRPGDQLRLRIEVVDVRTARSGPTLGIVRWTWRMRNQHDAEVLSLEATSLFELHSQPTER